jgi:integrase
MSEPLSEQELAELESLTAAATRVPRVAHIEAEAPLGGESMIGLDGLAGAFPPSLPPRTWRKDQRQVVRRQLRTALKTAGIADYVRPFHDLRHSSLTNGAAAGEQPIALMPAPVIGRCLRRRATCTWPGSFSATKLTRWSAVC